MNAEKIAKSTLGESFIKVLAAGMESRFRYKFFDPMNILMGTENLPGRIVLEVGCGTGYFTLPAARLIGEQGCLIAMDVLSDSVELVSKKVQAAELKNVRVFKGDALDTDLDAESFDTILLFGVIPAPMLPLNRQISVFYGKLKVFSIAMLWVYRGAPGGVRSHSLPPVSALISST